MVSAGSYLLGARLPGRGRPLPRASAPSASASACSRPGRAHRPAWSRRSTAVALLIWLSEILGIFNLLYAGTLVAASLSSWRGLDRASPAGGGGAGVSAAAAEASALAAIPSARAARSARRPRTPPTGPAGQSALVPADHGRRHRGGLRPLGPDHQAGPGPGHLQLRLALVPPALRGGHGAEPLRDRDALHGHGLHQLVLPAELRAAARGRDTADRPRHALAVHQLRLAGGRLPRRLVRRAALRPRPPHRRRRGDRARVPHAGRARARGGEERPRRGALCCWRRSRSSSTPGRQQPRRPSRAGGGEGLPAGRLAAGRRRAGGRPRRRDQGDRAGDGGGADRRRGGAGAGRQAAGGGWAGGSCRPCSAAASGTCATCVFAGSPLPEVAHLGPISLPHPERLQTGPARLQHRPLRDRHRRLAPLLLPRACTMPSARSGRWSSGARPSPRCWRSFAVATGSCAGWARWPCSGWSPICSRRSAPPAPRALRSPSRSTSATSKPALLAGLVLLPLARVFDGERRQWALMAALLVVLVGHRPLRRGPPRSRRASSPGCSWRCSSWSRRRCCSRRSRGAGSSRRRRAASPPWRWSWSRSATRCSATTCAIASATPSPPPASPACTSNSAYRWARDVSGARIGLAGTTRRLPPVRLLRHRPLQPRHLPRAKRARTAPSTRSRPAAPSAPPSTPPTSTTSSPLPSSTSSTPSDPIPSPEAGWLRGEPAVTPIVRSGPVTVWRVRGRLDPAACGPANAPLRRIPNAPGA